MLDSKWADLAPPKVGTGTEGHPEPTAPPALDPTTTAFQPASTYEVADVSSMDEFAQTRAPDDLFDDDFTPVAQPVEAPTPTPAPPTGPRDHNGHPHRGRGDGHGRGRGGRRDNVSTDVRTETNGASDQPVVPKEEARPGAVRGDRSKTGGVKKPKLTEDELSTRLASIKLKNAAREEAHRRAEADEASFRQREKQEQAKRAEERQNRQVMEGERERNRLRKLKAVGGLEWDSEKQEEDMVGARGSGNASQFRRGAYGGVTGGGGDGRQDSLGFDDRSDYAPRGGKSRGRGRGRGQGRGQGRGGSNNQQNARPEAEFPALPQAQAPKAQEPAAAPAAAAAKADPPNLDGANDTGPAAEAESASQAPATAETPAVVPENKGESVPEPSVLSPLGVNTGTWAEQVEAKATESGSGTAPG